MVVVSVTRLEKLSVSGQSSKVLYLRIREQLGLLLLNAPAADGEI
jgi:hypothetical protein